VSYLPEWKGPVEGYVVNFLKKNYWRVAATHEYEEAMQEARLVFLVCASHYPLLDTPQHFMALFKRTLENEFHDLSEKATKARALLPEQMDEDGPSMYDVVGELDNDGALRTMVRQAPSEVVMVLNLFLNAPQELLELAQRAWRREGHYGADSDKAVARMLGLPEGSTPVTTTKRYFDQDPV
jgi:hypothetical protein